MKLAEKPLKYFLGALLMGAAAHSVALSLGRVRGATLVGRPLDVTLSAQLEGSEGLAAVCATADVFFGDSQVAQNRVRLVTAQGANASEALIRIRTTTSVDEPVVTLYVREGCLQKSTRKYVLLAEIASENSNSNAVVDTGVMASSTAARAPGAASSATNGESTAPTAPAAPSARAARQTKPGKNRTSGGVESPGTAPVAPLLAMPAARVAGAPAKAAARKPGSRLKLDPIDLAAARDPVLRASPELLTEPSTNAQQRTAAAALWQALNAQPQDMVRDNQRLKSLEADVAGMLAQSQKTEKAVLDMRSQLEQARGERYNNWLVYTLSAILAAALLAALGVWIRTRQNSRRLSRGSWWGKEYAEDSAPYLTESPATAAETFVRKPHADALGSARASLDSLVDFDTSEPFSPAPSRMPAAGAQARPRSGASKFPAEFLPSLSGTSSMPRIVNAEELFDVQQQADFFLSLGRPDKAVEVLHHHIMDNVETSALVYLDLFDLYHSLGRRDDYDTLRADFNKMFNAKVPPFDEYAADTHDLEFYTTALSRIESLWPTPKVLDVLEESIFRKPDSRGEVFSLAAYRELLLLHSIAKKIVTRSTDAVQAPVKVPVAAGVPTMPDTLPRAAGFGPTSMQPLSARLQPAVPVPVLPPAVEGVPDPTQPPVSARIGLDIDLSVGENEGFVPLPSLETGAQLPAAADSNLIEFDLEIPGSVPVSSVPPKA
ncbi:MAG: hypothetical protein ABI893_08525 [Polaromonas sp.]